MRANLATLAVSERLGARAEAAVRFPFFGVETLGQRFAFILDVSGSMYGKRWTACTKELGIALRALPERVEFFVILFSDREQEPPGQNGWRHAADDVVDRAIEWVEKITPGGGTEPLGAFRRVLALEEPPDVIYLLTDGQMFGFSPADCAELLAPTLTIVNAIALGEGANTADLQTIASESGGAFTHVPD